MLMDDVPFVAIGNDELGEPLHIGDEVPCPHCGEPRTVRGTDDGRDVILMVKCGENAYLVGVAGRVWNKPAPREGDK